MTRCQVQLRFWPSCVADDIKPHLLYLFPEHLGDHVEISEVGLLWQDQVFHHLLVGHSTFSSAPSWYASQWELACLSSAFRYQDQSLFPSHLIQSVHKACSAVLKFNTSVALSSNFAFDYRTKQQIAWGKKMLCKPTFIFNERDVILVKHIHQDLQGKSLRSSMHMQWSFLLFPGKRILKFCMHFPP